MLICDVQESVYVLFVTANQVKITNLTLSEGGNPPTVVSQIGTLVPVGTETIRFYIKTTAYGMEDTVQLLILPFSGINVIL